MKGLAAGLLSAGAFLIVYGLGLGVPLMLLPSLPLLILGLHRPLGALAVAALVALVPVFFVGGLDSTLLFAALIAVPVLLFAPAAIVRDVNGEFRPIGLLLTDVAVFAALTLAGLMVYFQGQGGIDALIADALKRSLEQAEPEILASMDKLSGMLTVMVLSISAWWWVFLVYAHALIANWILQRQQKSVRLDLALKPFLPPMWLLGMLILAALGSVIAGGDMAQVAQVVVLVLLLPYFAVGATLLHEKIRAWPARGVLLFSLYFFTLSLGWPALIIASAGVWQQCKVLFSGAGQGT